MLKYTNEIIERPLRIGSTLGGLWYKHKKIKFHANIKGNRNKIYQFIIKNFVKKIKRKWNLYPKWTQQKLHDALLTNTKTIIKTNDDNYNQLIKKYTDIESEIQKIWA